MGGKDGRRGEKGGGGEGGRKMLLVTVFIKWISFIFIRVDLL